MSFTQSTRIKFANSATKEDICYLDPDMGGCSAFNINYYYNRFTGECHEFIFGGCLGNNNNFETLEECQEFCEETCDKKFERGPCEGYLVRYYYDKETDECKTFSYGGCRGNTNNFRLQKECMETCSTANA
ncbi:unnamed protein product [Larinioides sclopetarius]|uniref:BPTI/Kunitz inhibitor domain-containing protein n=1 Tax=Larinioides sclopetarius TaxID=280406 RepID=A0AAV2B4H7_9ARAC